MLPEDSPQNRDNNTHQMIYRNTGGKYGCDLLFGITQAFSIHCSGHSNNKKNRIEDENDAYNNKGTCPGKEVMTESIQNTQKNKYKGVDDNYALISESVQYSAHYWREKDIAQRADTVQKRDKLGPCSVNNDEDIGSEGQKDLFAGAEEYLKDIVA